MRASEEPSTIQPSTIHQCILWGCLPVCCTDPGGAKPTQSSTAPCHHLLGKHLIWPNRSWRSKALPGPVQHTGTNSGAPQGKSSNLRPFAIRVAPVSWESRSSIYHFSITQWNSVQKNPGAWPTPYTMGQLINTVSTLDLIRFTTETQENDKMKEQKAIWNLQPTQNKPESST